MYCYFILSFLITIIHFDLDYKIPGHQIDFAGYFLMSERGVWFPCLGICLRCFQIPLLSLWSEGDSCVYRTPPPPHPLLCWVWKVLVAQSCGLFVTPWTVAHQAPLSMGFSRQEYWSGLPYPPPGDLPNPRIEPRSPASPADSLPGKL